VARIEVLEFAALIEAMEAERRNPPKTVRKHRTQSVVGRVLTMAHQLGRDSTPLTDPALLRAAVN